MREAVTVALSFSHDTPRSGLTLGGVFYSDSGAVPVVADDSPPVMRLRRKSRRLSNETSLVPLICPRSLSETVWIKERLIKSYSLGLESRLNSHASLMRSHSRGRALVSVLGFSLACAGAVLFAGVCAMPHQAASPYREGFPVSLLAFHSLVAGFVR